MIRPDESVHNQLLQATRPSPHEASGNGTGFSSSPGFGTVMTKLVIDASVVVKWLLPQREDVADVERALMLLEGV